MYAMAIEFLDGRQPDQIRVIYTATGNDYVPTGHSVDEPGPQGVRRVLGRNEGVRRFGPLPDEPVGAVRVVPVGDGLPGC